MTSTARKASLLSRYPLTILYLLVVATIILGLSIYDAVFQDARVVVCVETSKTVCVIPDDGTGPLVPEDRSSDGTSDDEPGDR